MRIKPNYSVTDLMAIPVIQASITMSIYFFTVQIIFLLRDPLVYNIPQTDIATVTGDILFYSMPAQLISVLLIGYTYDIFGRSKAVFLMIFTMALCICILPLGAPYAAPYVYIVQNFFSIAYMGSIVHPLINDYICKDSRG